MNVVTVDNNIRLEDLIPGSIWYTKSKANANQFYDYFILIAIPIDKWIAIDLSDGCTTWCGLQTMPEEAIKGLYLVSSNSNISIERR